MICGLPILVVRLTTG